MKTSIQFISIFHFAISCFTLSAQHLHIEEHNHDATGYIYNSNSINGSYISFSNDLHENMEIGMTGTANPWASSKAFINIFDGKDFGLYYANTPALQIVNDVNGMTTVGLRAGLSNTLGRKNVFIGYEAGTNNTVGFQNLSIGFQALVNNSTMSRNISIGTQSLYSLNKGFGKDPLSSDIDNGSSYNLAIGIDAGAITNDTSGFGAERNTFIGNLSGRINTTGFRNTFLGFQTGLHNYEGSYNTFLGYEAGCSASTNNLLNATAIGSEAIVDASYKVVIGNNAVQTIGGYVGWTTYPSDRLFKSNILSNVAGLSFIMKLNPVTYHVNQEKLEKRLFGKDHQFDKSLPAKIRNEVKPMRRSGFIAQEVEEAAQSIGFDFDGVDRPKNGKDFYGIRYASFVVPLTKATQEQQKLIEEQSSGIRDLKQSINILVKQLADLKYKIEFEADK